MILAEVVVETPFRSLRMSSREYDTIQDVSHRLVRLATSSGRLVTPSTDRFSWGATMNQVGNILAKDLRFQKVGHVRDFFRGGRYTVCVWDLSSVQNDRVTAQA
jgi:hypothetical protein